MTRASRRHMAGIGRAAALVLAGFLATCPAASPASGIQQMTVEEAVAIAVGRSPAIRGARASADAARAARDRVAAERSVQLRLDSRLAWLSEVPTVQPAPGNPPIALGEDLAWSASLVASKVVWSGGRIPASIAQADASADAAGEIAARGEQGAAFAAERAFHLLLAAQEETVVARQTLAAAESHLRAATARHAAGSAARFDVIRAEVQAEEARQAVIQRESQRASAVSGLLLALGMDGVDLEAVPPRVVPGPRPGLPELIDAAVASRPELAAARHQVRAAAASVTAARAERMPFVTLGADYQVAEPDSATQFDRLSVGAALTVPILDGGRAAARRREALAASAQAGAALDALTLQVENEVRQAWARLASAEAQVVVAGRRIEQAEELLRLAGVRYDGGVGTATEIADAQSALAAARSGLTRASAEARIAEAELRLATGVPPGAPLNRRGTP